MTNSTGRSGPLAGLRVLDLTINVLGPVATQILGDMGADVIKIEPPDGDPMRDSGYGLNPGMSALFMNMNRNKRSVILDLKLDSDRSALLTLADGADVLVHSMRPKAMMRLGLDYEQLAKRYPRLVYAFAPGYDQRGPYRDRPAYDDVIQGESGLADMVGMTTGKPGYLPTVLVDKTCGVYLASAIGMALYSRERNGLGQEVQTPMLEAMLSFNLIEHLCAGTYGDPNGLGYARALSPDRRPYATKDGFMCVLAVNDSQWRRLFAALGRSEIMSDPKYATMAERTRNISELYGILSAAISEFDSKQLHDLFLQSDIPHGAMNRLSDLFSDEHLVQTGFFRRYDHPSEGPVISTAVPQQFSGTPVGVPTAPPGLGEHTDAVLREAGIATRTNSSAAGAAQT